MGNAVPPLLASKIANEITKHSKDLHKGKAQI